MENIQNDSVVLLPTVQHMGYLKAKTLFLCKNIYFPASYDDFLNKLKPSLLTIYSLISSEFALRFSYCLS